MGAGGGWGPPPPSTPASSALPSLSPSFSPTFESELRERAARASSESELRERAARASFESELQERAPRESFESEFQGRTSIASFKSELRERASRARFESELQGRASRTLACRLACLLPACPHAANLSNCHCGLVERAPSIQWFLSPRGGLHGRVFLNLGPLKEEWVWVKDSILKGNSELTEKNLMKASKITM